MRGLRNLITRANFCLLFLQLSKTSLNSRKLSCTLKRQNPNSDNPGQTFTFKKGKNRRKQMTHRTGARAHATRAGRCGGSDSLSGAPRNLRMKRNERKYRHGRGQEASGQDSRTYQQNGQQPGSPSRGRLGQPASSCWCGAGGRGNKDRRTVTYPHPTTQILLPPN